MYLTDMSLDFQMCGSWELKSGTIIVTDPSYQRCYTERNAAEWTIASAYPGALGLWESAIQIGKDKAANRVCMLISWHSKAGCLHDIIHRDDWLPEIDQVGVDTGMLGIFDYKQYPVDPDEKDGEGDFFGHVCNIMWSDQKASTISVDGDPIGVVTSSGWGDGIYTVRSLWNRDWRVGLAITFISDQSTFPEYRIERGRIKRSLSL